MATLYVVLEYRGDHNRIVGEFTSELDAINACATNPHHRWYEAVSEYTDEDAPF